MFDDSHAWALVLAAGDGSRLRSLTMTPSGTAVPKQFCSLYEGPSLLQEALARAHAVTAQSRTCAVVADQHRRWWEAALWNLTARNVIIQPRNRGTAVGILLPLVHILARDPDAQLVLLPSDHHVREESLIIRALCEALGQFDWRYHESLLLGIEPEEADPELGYIVPGPSDGRGALNIARFVEKPSLPAAHELVRDGGLWNTFIVVCSARALLEQFRQCVPDIVQAIYAAIRRDRDAGTPGEAIAELYERLPIVDFSRDIVCGHESHFRALPVPRCGWSDLGTPSRVAKALRHPPRPQSGSWADARRGYLSLARAHQRARMAQQVAAAP